VRATRYEKAASLKLQTKADGIVVALVTAVCVLGLNAAFTSFMHATAPFLVSVAVPAYPFIAYLLTRPITLRSDYDALVWSSAIIALSLLTFFFYAG